MLGQGRSKERHLDPATSVAPEGGHPVPGSPGRRPSSILKGMAIRRLNPISVLAIIVALAAVRPMWLLPHAHGEDESPHAHCVGHAHHHEHSHGDLTHSHGHHHHPGESHDEDEPDHDHGVLDHPEDSPKVRWLPPRRAAQIDAPPVAPAPAVLAGSLPSEWTPSRRGKPPPLVDHRTPQLTSLRTIVLRL